MIPSGEFQVDYPVVPAGTTEIGVRRWIVPCGECGFDAVVIRDSLEPPEFCNRCLGNAALSSLKDRGGE